MIRLTLLWVIVVGLSIYAWKNWYVSLCGLIVLMAVVQHPDVPATIFGVQGLNPWNLLLLMVVLAWMLQRGRDELVWDLPRLVGGLLLLYLVVVVIGVIRMMSDASGLAGQATIESPAGGATFKTGLARYTTAYLVSEYLVNTVKWVVPGLLLFHGAKTRPRVVAGLASVLSLYLLLSLQVIRWMPPSFAFSGQALSERSAKILLHEIGYHRVNLSMMLAGASWAVLATTSLARHRRHLLLILGASLLVVYAQALTGGRMGYATWGILGLILCGIRWHRYLTLVPLVVVAVVLVAPGAAERMAQGFSSSTRDSNARLTVETRERLDSSEMDPDLYTITAGRNVAWPYVLDKIAESPVFGFGRLAMLRTGITGLLWAEFEESFGHPHNAYLELILDNGLVGFFLVMPFYAVMLLRSVALFRDPSPLSSAIGGATCALILALLIASFGSQTFYPREGSVGMWCAIGLMLRVSLSHREHLGSPFNALGGSWWQSAGIPHDPPHRPRELGSDPLSPRGWWQPS